MDTLKPLDFSLEVEFDENGHIIRNKGLINDCYVCVRPGNKKSVPKVYLDQSNNDERIIVHNYGHGGIGWSTLWGSVIHSINIAEKTLNNQGKSFSNFDGKIAVIGAGCVGCATILLLIDKGVHPSKIELITDKLEDTTSHRSGAMLSTASVLEKIDDEIMNTYNEININTYLTWQAINNGEKFDKLKEGVTRLKAFFGAEKEWGTIETESGLDIFVEHGLIPPPEIVEVKFKDRINLMRKYEGCFYFNPFKLMSSF
jgi:hypothetical protein